MMEIPSDSYFESNSKSIELLQNEGFEGIYISFQRPFENVSHMLSQRGINMEKLLFVDLASMLTKHETRKNAQCINISSSIDIDELVRAIYLSLQKINSNKKFVFIDSLSTITLYKPLSETLRFSEFLIRTVAKGDINNVALIFNVAKNLSQKKFIKDVVVNVDEIIQV